MAGLLVCWHSFFWLACILQHRRVTISCCAKKGRNVLTLTPAFLTISLGKKIRCTYVHCWLSTLVGSQLFVGKTLQKLYNCYKQHYNYVMVNITINVTVQHYEQHYKMTFPPPSKLRRLLIESATFVLVLNRWLHRSVDGDRKSVV